MDSDQEMWEAEDAAQAVRLMDARQSPSALALPDRADLFEACQTLLAAATQGEQENPGGRSSSSIYTIPAHVFKEWKRVLQHQEQRRLHGV